MYRQWRSKSAGTSALSLALMRALLQALLLGVLCLWAADTLSQTNRAAVRLDGNALFQLSAETRAEARQRADEVESRLQRLLETPETLAPVVVTAEEGERHLTSGGRPILTLTEEDATDHQMPLDALAREWKATLEAELRRAAERRLSGWGRFKAETQASVQNAFARMLESAITIIPRLLAGLLVLLFFWGLATFLRWLMRMIFCRISSDPTVENLFKQVAYYSVWLIGLVVATSALGYDPQALATGLGLTGVALGFALKDILSNFVSGILILAMRPFEIGDQIVIGETEGSVERINLRATRIRTYDGRAVLVPNGEVFTSRVTNNTESPIRRGDIVIPLGYDADLKAAVAAIRAAVQSAEGVLADPPIAVEVRELGKSEITLEARFWTDSRRSDYLHTASRARTAITRVLKEENIGLPNPAVRIIKPEPGPDSEPEPV